MDWPLAIRAAEAEPIMTEAAPLISPLSGASQIVVNPACLHGMDILLPAMSEPNARIALSWLMVGRRQLVRFPWFNLSGRTLGNFSVVGWSGRDITLNSDPRPFTDVGEGVSILFGGRRYLHLIEATGSNWIRLSTPFRAAYDTSAIVSLGAPLLEGRIESPQPKLARVVQGFRFAVREVR